MMSEFETCDICGRLQTKALVIIVASRVFCTDCQVSCRLGEKCPCGFCHECTNDYKEKHNEA